MDQDNQPHTKVPGIELLLQFAQEGEIRNQSVIRTVDWVHESFLQSSLTTASFCSLSQGPNCLFHFCLISQGERGSAESADPYSIQIGADIGNLICNKVTMGCWKFYWISVKTCIKQTFHHWMALYSASKGVLSATISQRAGSDMKSSLFSAVLVLRCSPPVL